MRISDWSSDVCSSDLVQGPVAQPTPDKTASLPELLLNDEGEETGKEGEEGEEDEELARLKYDLPPYAKRSLGRIGILTPRTHGLEPDAFGQAGGQYLTILMKATRAPVISRWASILLRSEEHTSELQSLMRISYAV